MSKLKISSNLFLEVNELNKLVEFIDNSNFKVILKTIIKKYGIIPNDDSYFKVTRNTENEVIVNSGIAVDSNINFIHLRENVKIPLKNTTNKQWITISHATTNDEIGVVNISNKGNLIGINTKFLSVLRGQPNFPTKVKFTSENNNEEYEVVRVISDTEAIISGSFIEENNLKYQVVGTFTPGFQVNESDKCIYEYDSCFIGVIESEEKPAVDENTFIIASVDYSSGIMNIEDKIENLFNAEYNELKSVKITNPLVSLIESRLSADRILDLHIEWGFKIASYEVTKKSDETVFTIISGSNNYIQTAYIPDNIFKGWKLLNKKNMISVNIDYNESRELYISSYDSNLVTGTNDEFVIIPNFNDIEISVRLSNNKENIKHYSKHSIANSENRIYIPIEYGETSIELAYRMMNSDKTTTFQDFSMSNFKNINGDNELLKQSSFNIFVNKPENIENYS